MYLTVKERVSLSNSLTIWEELGKPSEVVIPLPETKQDLKIATSKKPYQAYTAGPLFTTLQRTMIEEIAAVVASKKVVPWSPHVMGFMLKANETSTNYAIFKQCVRGVDTSDFLIMWADYGLEPDPGTVWEQSRAYIMNKPIIALREDGRNTCSRSRGVVREEVMNLMMEQSVDFIARNLGELATAIDSVIQYLNESTS